MLLILGTWLIIFIICIVIGDFLANVFAWKKGIHTVDLYFVLGLLVINLYAEVYSIFDGVGRNAFLVVAGLTLPCLIYDVHKMKKKFFIQGKSILNIFASPMQILKIVMCILICIGAMAYTSDAPWHSDTNLYHAQAIRWIEEYGVVKGLGNLHNRLAYNSAFFPLQALFSFKWMLGQSLHTINGLAAYLLFIYALCTNDFIWGRGYKMSDWLKIVGLVYVYHERVYFSSPETDMLALILVVYIMIKWTELYEKNDTNIENYCILCILAIWAVTIKLSTAMLVILCIYPFVLLVKEKKWMKVCIFLGGAVGIAIPWIVRNILISGYIVYPYSQIDVINVDWKIPKYLVDYDRMEIMVWGRGVCDVTKYSQSFFEWFPIWFGKLTKFEMIVWGLGVFGILTCVIMFVKKFKTIENSMKFLMLVSIISFVFWMLSAPLMRYGIVYSLCVFAIGFSMLAKTNFVGIVRMPMYFVLLIIVSTFWQRANTDPFPKVIPIDYVHYDAYEVQWNDIVMYIPTEDTIIGYHWFPSTPREDILSRIELREKDLSGGFRSK